MQQHAPRLRDLVLLGGGHSHVQVLKSAGMRPLTGVRLTLICREVETPYSGMLPGHVAGLYDRAQIHIDLARLARFAGARLLAAEATGLDLEGRQVLLGQHPPVRFDLLSINTGAVPAELPGVGTPVKPIGRFLPRWDALRASVRSGERVALVGGGAGGVELALAMRRALPADVGVVLVSDSLLPGHPGGVVSRLRRALQVSGVELVMQFRVDAVDCDSGQGERPARRLLRSSDGRSVSATHLFWVTGVTAPPWIAASGLATDPGGFVAVDRYLRSTSHPCVFAAGDVAALVHQPRPKAGVYAVREGPVLGENLRRAVAQRPLRPFRAQRRFLSLIGMADGRAVASRGPLVAQGAWVWRWKDRIDRRFMARFQDLPEMARAEFDLPAALRAEAPETMRCGGCGAKLGADPLRRVLARLPQQRYPNVSVGIGDDAAVVQVAGGALLLTVDGFRSLVDDPYLFGRITAHHSLNDVIAMGGHGTAALALATVPLMAESMMEDELYALLRGAVDVLNAQGVPRVGGHSAEGAELSLGLTITGALDGPALGKAGLRAGDALVLNKPVGTGVILAAHMRGLAGAAELAAALESMDRSNAPALTVFRDHDVHALTDVTGFGLIGHLAEMLRAGGVRAQLRAGAVPALPGAARLLAAGVASSLQSNNELALQDFELHGVLPADPRVRLLADPQTSGGLLAGVAAARADACVAELRALGFDAAVIGTVVDVVPAAAGAADAPLSSVAV
ncbi:MAG: selenide, water dikinase SelD [Pseudomonadales bacterium]